MISHRGAGPGGYAFDWERGRGGGGVGGMGAYGMGGGMLGGGEKGGVRMRGLKGEDYGADRPHSIEEFDRSVP